MIPDYYEPIEQCKKLVDEFKKNVETNRQLRNVMIEKMGQQSNKLNRMDEVIAHIAQAVVLLNDEVEELKRNSINGHH